MFYSCFTNGTKLSLIILIPAVISTVIFYFIKFTILITKPQFNIWKLYFLKCTTDQIISLAQAYTKLLNLDALSLFWLFVLQVLQELFFISTQFSGVILDGQFSNKVLVFTVSYFIHD